MSFSMISTTPSNSFGSLPKDTRLSENNNNNPFMMDGNQKILEIWNKHTFQSENFGVNVQEMKVNGWIHENISKEKNEIMDKIEVEREDSVSESPKEEPQSPSHHARRPMNAFLIFCKKHRPIVRDRFPNLENRGVTKILGEWWSLLEEEDKTPFTNLANEYKDAFLTANPNFKWYKLPAPPLRTLMMVRPPNSTIKLPSSPQSSPSHNSSTPQIFKEFTPGKLADESQLGSLTSLLNNDFGKSEHVEKKNKSSFELNIDNNNVMEYDKSEKSPVNLMKPSELPPKPIKKRIFPTFSGADTKETSRDILNEESNEINCYYFKTEEHQRKSEDSVTNQDLVDKIVDNLFFEKDDKTRKSGRQCKGKRYEKFMMEGKLLGNKKDATLTQNKPETVVPEKKSEMSTPNLENTIKRLAERTKLTNFQVDEEKDDFSSPIKKHNNETSDETSLNANFNLDEKINDLPSLSYDSFLQKKRESKKRKLRKISCENSKDKEKIMKKEELVGSKKRKNKHSITHLENKNEKNDFNDLLGLATLAEVAANTQKIN